MNLYEEAQKLNIDIDEKKAAEFEKYKEMMLEYNKVVNLTAITEDDEIKEKHFLDCAALTLCPELFEGCSLIDIGAGGGFPSIPVKLVRKDIKLTMLDSLNKRISFLRSVTEALKLDNAQAIHMRAEDGGQDKSLREQFDIATARAVADLSVLAELALPFVRVGGYFIALKGSDISQELENAKPAIKTLGGKTQEVREIVLPSGIKHSLVVIKKLEKTPNKYPRKAGKPSKDPIR
ncbi:MAG: 16S rRNA (guanine(527)-N(7))-methyltransferase RsmG [Clostridia bacterium]|nr:16S rRNA (guanine(527)-N(7))-methyltransferase RsmG [Clostridia bacterium]